MATKEKTHTGEARPDVHRNAAERTSSQHHAPASVQPVEAEDPIQSGGHPHLQKRILNENFEGGAAQQHPESPAGQHATGSFTGGDSPDLTKTHPGPPARAVTDRGARVERPPVNTRSAFSDAVVSGGGCRLHITSTRSAQLEWCVRGGV